MNQIFLLAVLLGFISHVFGEGMQAGMNETEVTSGAHYGIDVSTTISSSSAKCFKDSGYEFVVPRGYRSSGSVDTQVCTSIINSYNAGIAKRDTYLFHVSPGCLSFCRWIVYFPCRSNLLKECC